MNNKTEPTRQQENKTVLAKLSREEFSRFQNYCEKKEKSINAVIKGLILDEVDNPANSNIAGKNIFLYNQGNDSFTWRLLLDDRSEVDLIKDVSVQYLEQLFDGLREAMSERNIHLKRKNKGSVPVPTKLMKK